MEWIWYSQYREKWKFIYEGSRRTRECITVVSVHYRGHSKNLLQSPCPKSTVKSPPIWIPQEIELKMKWTQQMWNNSILFHNKTKFHITLFLNTWNFTDNLKLVQYKNVREKKCGKISETIVTTKIPRPLKAAGALIFVMMRFAIYIMVPMKINLDHSTYAVSLYFK